MNKSEHGFGLVELLLTLVLITFIGILSFFAFSRIDTSKKYEEYEGKLGLYLTGATDDNYDNYYKLGFKLEDILTGCGANDLVDVKTDTKFEHGQLQLAIYASVQKAEDNGDAYCLAIPQPYEGSIDVKEYLGKEDALDVTVNNNKHTIYVDKAKRTLRLDNSEPIPYYPDKVAVLGTYPCDRDSTNNLSAFIETNGLTLADLEYPGLNNLYRRPTKEIHIIVDNKAREVAAQYKNQYADESGNIMSPDCTPKIFKPNLHDLSQQLSP